ncbi:MAG: cell surface protein SprA [Bacteroidota bacterium]
MKIKGYYFLLLLLSVGFIQNAVAEKGFSYNLESPYFLEAESFFNEGDTLPPISDRDGDFINNQGNNPFDLNDPPAIEKEVTYDPETGQYIITERIGGNYFRAPTYMSFDEYVEWQAQQQQRNFFNQMASDADLGPSGKDPIERYESNIKSSLIDRLFGGTTVDIRPSGNIDLTFGADFQRVDNPILTEQQRKQGGFDFDMAIQMDVIGKIGEKLQLSTNYNTQATFDFENQVKLEFGGTEDDILQKIEAGNVSLPLRSSLIQGSQSLFGLRTDLKFGRLNVSTIVSQKKSKRNNVQIQGGTQQQTFEVTADDYDENRHFFLSHYNRDNFERAQLNLPQINTVFRITKLEVWITNTRNATEGVRDIVALADLGEPQRVQNTSIIVPSVPRFPDITGTQGLPDNDANSQFDDVMETQGTRDLDNAVSSLQGQLNYTQIEDFEKVRARLLSPSEYNFHPELGYISLNVNLQPEDVLGVAFEYTYNGEVHQVGEFTNDVPISPDTLNVLYVKLLKSTTANVGLPMWDLMMKNVYGIGAFQVNQQDFKLDIFYQDAGGGEKRFIPKGSVNGTPLISLFNLDNLNSYNDPISDGVFDFVPGITINPRNGRVIFPILEPFGSHLEAQFDDPDVAREFVYQQLYDSTITIAREYPEFNRFLIRGSYKSSISSEISLGSFNIPRGSVNVSAGGQQLIEGRDYEVDYNIGRVRILNESILNSGIPVNVSFEDNTLFGFQTKTLYGMRLDYTISENFNIGGTFMKLHERPFTQKVNIGDDPISNSVYGLDVQYSTEAPWLTKAIDKLPLIQTKAPSNISFTAEGAALRPGHSKAINNRGDEKGGIVYLDDFEGSSTNFDLRTPSTSWIMASTPRNPRFPEADSISSLVYGINRAKLAWYRIDPIVRSGGAASDPYTRAFSQRDVFRNLESQNIQNTGLFTFDMAYFPKERGSYNFDGPPGTIDVVGTGDNYGIDQDGDLLQPENRWGGIMRSLETNDFEAANIEFVEFWMLSPFQDRVDESGATIPNVTSDGKLYINLGSVSEDILRDSRKFFENGLPNLTSEAPTDTTVWSRIPRVQAVTNAFDNDPAVREIQDVGLDGFDNLGEVEQFQDYLDVMNSYITDPDVLAEINADPSNDDYYYHSNETRFGPIDAPNSPTIIDRYKFFNHSQGNSLGENTSYTNLPDSEDLNRDNTLSETESFYEYEIPIERDPLSPDQMQFNQFVVDSVESTGGVWYQIKVPIDQFTSKHGGIQDFRSIRFIRMYMTEFDDEIILRFARLQLVRNQWRRYTRDLVEPGVGGGGEMEPTTFDVTAVNIEENSARQPFPYVLPAGIQRETALGAFPNALQNEQSLSLDVCGLDYQEAKGIYKLLNFDFRRYQRMKMFVHAESPEDLEPGNLVIFMRLGSDFERNYYEYEIPLVMSEPLLGTESLDEITAAVWREENSFDFPLELFRDVKVERNASGVSSTGPYSTVDPEDPENTVRVLGNPDLGLVKGVMIGIRNRDETQFPHCAEVWVNELRLTGLDERGGTAGLARLDVTLADFGNFTVSGNYTSIGWGGLEERVDQRAKEEVVQYDFATNLELGKLLPKNAKIRIPFYAQYSNTIKTPEFDPYDLDIPLKQKIEAAENQATRDSLREQAVDYTSIRSFNFTNVRKDRTNPQRKPMFWDIENFSLTYAYSHTVKRDPTIQRNSVKDYRGSIDYGWSPGLKPIEPFKKLIKSKSKWFGAVKDFSFSPLPSSFTFRTEMNRQFGKVTYRFADPSNSTYFDKRFFWDRSYGLNWNLTGNLTFSYNAVNNSVIDEPEGPNDEVAKQIIWDNIKDFGRTKNFNQNVSVNYQLPTRKIPFLDWTQVRASYSGNYTWSAASLNVDTLGNVIQNGQTRQINGDLDFTKLYNKSKYLRKINSKSRSGGNSRDRGGNIDNGRDNSNPRGRGGLNDPRGGSKEDFNKKDSNDKNPRDKGKGNDKGGPNGLEDSPELANQDGKGGKKSKEDKKKKEREPSIAERIILRPLMTVRKARFSFSENISSVVPGFMPSPRFFGLSDGFNAPGLGYAFGFQQPKRDYLDEAAANGWITTNVFQNQQVFDNYSQTYDAKVTLEPFKDFRVELNANRSYTENHSEYFKVTTPGGDFQHLNALDAGSLTMTFFSLGTLFEKTDAETISETFQTFENNREIISQRWGALNPRSDGQHAEDGSGYTEGYGRFQQDVLIPAFLSAYTNNDPNTYKLNVFKILPKPNWRLTYNGLSKIKGLDKIFQSFSLTHGYTSTLTLNRYATDLDFDPQYNEFNENTFNYFSPFEIPDLVISEQFSPLIGLDVKFANELTARIDIKKSRTLALNLTDYQLIETKRDEITIGMGYRIKAFKLPFNLSKKAPTEENDLNINFDFSLSDDKTVNHLLDQEQAVPTRGSRSIRISPSIDYTVNERVNVRIFFDRSRTIPATSASFPITNTQAGVTIRFSLTQ